ncbi:MAG: spermidine synthase, partial [Candidatus Acidiferrales bacterium]
MNSRTPAEPPLFTPAIFSSAFLLFLIQPMIAKIIVPWFGGSAAVWITCLLFYQVALLLGYAYAHLLASRAPRTQLYIHAALLAASALLLPVIPGAQWKPVGAEAPALRILGLLAATIGLPFVLLAATSPLLQACYARVLAGAQPYRFFAVSNAGSLLGLLGYPLLFEPWFTTRQQAIGWSMAYAAVCALIGWLLLRHRGAPGVAGAAADDRSVPSPDRATRLLWLALSACAVVLLYGVTNHLTQNIAAIPFLWVLPLSLYLLSFIFCFGRRSFYHRGLFLKLLAVALGGMAYALGPDSVNAGLELLLPLYLAGLFVCCIVLHGELAQLKPHPAHLTRFYLYVSLGGALGGVYAGALAPQMYAGYYEFHVALGACALLALFVMYRDPRSRFYRATWQPLWLGLMTLAGFLLGSLYFIVRDEAQRTLLTARNFYGSLRVTERDNVKVVWLKDDAEHMLPDPRAQRKLVHGTIDHGVQFLAPERRREPAGYYAEDTGAGLALVAAGKRGAVRVGIVGLGTGTLAAYGRPGDVYRFYEINPLVERIARAQFTYLGDSEAQVEIVTGDARLAMERQPAQNYDVLAVDAFSSDAIPIHLLTLEAFREYFRHIRPDGVLVLHISNRYVELQPVAAAAAQSLGKAALVVKTGKDDTRGAFATTWVVLGDANALARLSPKDAGRPPVTLDGFAPWTDD